MAIGLRTAWHFNLIPNFDTYFGIGLGYVIYNYKNTYYNTNVITYDWSFFDYGAYIGLRWYFLGFMGIYIEAGYTGLNYAQAGLTFKF
jgi:hypothetical protein